MNENIIMKSIIIVLMIILTGGASFAVPKKGIPIQEVYDVVLEEFDDKELKERVIIFFESNFDLLKTEIETEMFSYEAEELMEFLMDEFYEYAEMIEEVKLYHPKEFERWVKYKQRDYKTHVLGRKYRGLHKNSNPAKEKVKEELKQILKELLKLKLVYEKQEIEELEAELKELKEVHQKRFKHQEEIVETRLKELTGESDIFRWE